MPEKPGSIRRESATIEGQHANEGISHTALTVAHGRTLSDIPYSKEILQQYLKAEDTFGIPQKELEAPELAPRFEARYKMTNLLLSRSGIDQVLELASGLSPRGLQLTTGGSVKEFVEIDLPKVASIKKRILKGMSKDQDILQPESLHIVSGNVLEQRDMKNATRFFDPQKPIAIVTEGLLRYFTRGQKEKLALNVRTLLQKSGGVWITTDIVIRRDVNTVREQERIARVKRMAGVDMEQNKFESVEQAQKFFEGLGFSVEKFSLGLVNASLSSINKLDADPEGIRERVARGTVFVMRTKLTGGYPRLPRS